MTKETKGLFIGLIGVSAFAFTLPVTRMVVQSLDPVFTGLGRAVLAGVFAAIMLVAFRVGFPNKKQFLQLLIVSLCVVVGFPVFSAIAMQYVPATHGAVILGLLPLCTALAGALIVEERPSLGFWLAGFSGSALVVCYALSQGAGTFQVADLALLAAIVSAAIGYAVEGRLSRDLGSWQVICWALVLAFPFIIVPAIYTMPMSFSGFPATTYFGFLYLALISQFLAFFAWYKGLALGGIARVSQAQLLQPFITIFASFMFFHEVVDIETILFATLVMILVWIGKRMPIRQKV